MRRHEWGSTKRPADNPYRIIYESCVHCDAERVRGHWATLKRPDRYGISLKWRAPGTIRGLLSCPGARVEDAEP